MSVWALGSLPGSERAGRVNCSPKKGRALLGQVTTARGQAKDLAEFVD